MCPITSALPFEQGIENVIARGMNKIIKVTILQDEHNERLKKDKATSRFKNAYGESDDWNSFQHFVSACDTEQMHVF